MTKLDDLYEDVAKGLGDTDDLERERLKTVMLKILDYARSQAIDELATIQTELTKVVDKLKIR